MMGKVEAGGEKVVVAQETSKGSVCDDLLT